VAGIVVPISPSSETQTILDSMGTSIDVGDSYLARKKWENAVLSYQGAAQTGRALNPTLAAQIQQINWHLASEADATHAQSLAKKMLAQSDAVSIGGASQQTGGLAIVVVLGAISAAALAWALLSGRK
jgi:hypothetical protein